MLDTKQLDQAIFESELPDGSIEKAVNSMKRSVGMMRDFGRLGERSPWKKFDDVTKGFIRGKIYTIGAYSNTGKSKFAYMLTNHFLEMGKKVIFFSLEVDSGMVLQNLMCNKYKMRYSDFKDPDGIKSKIGNDYDNLQIFDTVYNLGDIENIVQHYKPDFVFIDFVQNIQTDQGSNYEKLARIAIAIQQLAIVTGSTIISLSQLSNASARQVGMGDTSFVSLKGAGELFASSDVVLILKKEEPGLILMRVVKNKYGRADDDFYFDVDFSIGQFRLRGTL